MFQFVVIVSEQQTAIVTTAVTAMKMTTVVRIRSIFVEAMVPTMTMMTVKMIVVTVAAIAITVNRIVSMATTMTGMTMSVASTISTVIVVSGWCWWWR